MKLIRSICLVALCTLLSCTERSSISLEQNKKVVQRLFNEVINQGKMSVIDELMSDDILMHDATSPDPKIGKENYRGVVKLFREAFPDGKYYIVDLIAESEKVAVFWRLEGYHRGIFMNMPPSNNKVKVSGILIFRFENNKIVEYWGVFDMLLLMKQIGALNN